MTEFSCKPGDVLLYSHSPTLIDALIDEGERLEDGPQDRECYHVAVALDAYMKIETKGWRVEKVPIDYENCRIYRPPYDSSKLNNALGWGIRQLGRFYGYVGVIDQALRDISRGGLHMPRWFIGWMNHRMPYCSVLTAGIMVRAGFNEMMHRLGKAELQRWPPPSPEDIYLVVKDWEVVDTSSGGHIKR